jgi:phage terminase large subunit-like protein
MAATAPLPVIKAIREAKHLSMMPRDRLVDLLSASRDLYNKWIRYQVIVNGRNDILAEILGYEVVPTLHFPIIRHQALHPQSMVLAFRGGGKTTIATITDAVGEIVRYPDIRLLIASKTLQNSQDFMKEIKGHFESNVLFREIFGDLVGRNQWDERSIEVAGRTQSRKEPTIMTVGVDGAVASKHYDGIYADDLVEEENSRTEYMRNRLKRWFYSVLMPCLEPPDPNIPARGKLRVSGTRYHPEDHYDHLQKNELKESTLIVPALSADGQSAWPAKFSAEQLKKLRRTAGIVIFNAQYQCDCEAMKGEIFQYDHFERHPLSDFPKREDMKVYMGVDLAIGEKESNDKFALAVIGVLDEHYWILAFEESRLRFNVQTDRILKYYKEFKPIWCGVEVNAYQKAQLHNLKDRLPSFRGMAITTIKDKVTRAWKLTPYFETGKVHFKNSETLLMDRLVTRSATVKKHWDAFDALDLAFSAAHRRVRKARKPFGLI